MTTIGSNLALVLGATGNIGGEVARQLRDTGWQVRALKRDQAKDLEKREGLTWMRGDAMNREDVLNAARGCAVIVHAVNPPGYRRWSEWVLPMLDNSVAAAIAEHATILLPGNIYNYDPNVCPVIAEDAAQNPVTRKGEIRAELERRLHAASRQGARVIIVRAGDFFGPRVVNTWFSPAMVKPGQSVTTINLPGDPGVGHLWSYVPDVAHTMVALLECRDRLEPFANFHMSGHWDADGKQMCASIRRVVSRRTGIVPKTRDFPWWQIALTAPFMVTLREILKMRYLWRQPIRMSNARLVAVLGQEPHTPLDEAIETTLIGIGCLDAKN